MKYIQATKDLWADIIQGNSHALKCYFVIWSQTTSDDITSSKM